MNAGPLIACHECDLLQRETVLADGGSARCRRCGAVLYRSSPPSLDWTLALTLAAMVLFAIANFFPIVGLSVNGNLVETTLFGAARILYLDGMWPLAGLGVRHDPADAAARHGRRGVPSFAAVDGTGSAPPRYRSSLAAPGVAVGNDRSADSRDAGRARQARGDRKRGSGNRLVGVWRRDAAACRCGHGLRSSRYLGPHRQRAWRGHRRK